MILLKKTDEAMKAAGCEYYLDAGTLLGAVRHKGFIPWDDDADICMTRENYDRFLAVGKKYFDGDFELIIPAQKGEERFYDFVPKVIYKKAVFDKGSETDIFYGGTYSRPALDIFVIDRVPDGKLAQKINTALLKVVYGLAMGHRKSIDYKKYGAAEGFVIRILSFIGRFIPLYKTARLYDSVSRRYEKKVTSYVMSTHSAMDAFGDCYEAGWYEKGTTLEIEGETFPAPVGFDGILKTHYGSYMTLPPEEKRKPKHLDFDGIEFYD